MTKYKHLRQKSLYLTVIEVNRLDILAKQQHVSTNMVISRALNWYYDMQKEVNTGDWRLETRIVDRNGDEVKKMSYIE